MKGFGYKVYGFFEAWFVGLFRVFYKLRYCTIKKSAIHLQPQKGNNISRLKG